MKELQFGILFLLCLFLFPFLSVFAQSNTCSSATLLSGCLTNRSVLGATPDFTGACSGTVRYDVWYKFTATSTNPTITLSNIGSTFSGHKPKLGLFTACGAANSITCSGTSLTASGLSIATDYYIRIYALTADASATPTTTGNFDICITNPAPITGSRMGEVFMPTTLSGTNLIDDPWEITYGPDNFLWVTEAKGYRVYRIDPNSGARTTILDLSNTGTGTGYLTGPEHTAYNRTFNISTNNPQGGLAGLALHPDWANKKYVYLSYVHSYNSTAANSAGVFFTNRIVRFTYNTSTDKLESPVTICNTLPGSGDHNSQRMIIAPVGSTNYLFYAAGDMGAGQFGNAQRPNNAQTLDVYEGKILRFNLEPVLTDPVNDQWIPSDNPFNANPVAPSARNAVWSLGIRNNQGFAYIGGKLFGSSHGPYSDDEINVIDRQKNYGHPKVIGYAYDGNYNGSKAGHRNGNSNDATPTNHPTSLPLISDEAGDSVLIPNYKTPLYSGYPSTQADINNIWTLENDGDKNTGIGNGAWPSEGWSGMDAYTHTLIPGWKNSLVLASLKWGRMLRFKIDAAAEDVLPIDGYDTLSYFGSKNRFRDMAIAPNGKDIFLVMDKSETTSGPSAANPRVSACNGCVQKYTFLGYVDNAGESSIPAAMPVTSGAANSCSTGTGVTIDASNNNVWVPITGPDGNIMAEIFANGQNLGAIQSSFYTASTARLTGGRRFAGRNFFIDPTTNATGIKIRLYITQAEFDTWKPTVGSVIGDVRIFQNTDACRSYPVGAMAALVPSVAKAHGGGYVLQANSINITNSASFYLANNGVFILPMDLLTFNGSLIGNATLLKWTTENEVNTSHFIVERSLDGVTFSAIGNKKAAGKSNSKTNYSFPDKDVLTLNADVVYYRLKSVDANNVSKYSNVISISILDRNTIVSISPNPVSNVAQVRITPGMNGTMQWRLIDNAGRTLQSNQIQVQKNRLSIFEINMAAFAQGTYYIQVTGSGADRNIKLQKL